MSVSQQTNKLSLFAAIIINVNIMTGAGIFINTAQLAKRAGALGSLGYALVSILLLPLIVSFVKLIELHPTGGFFFFSGLSNYPLVRFLRPLSYFICKI